MHLRPPGSEFAPYCAKYVAMVPVGELASILQAETATFLALLHSISETKSLHRYAPGKWSIRETLLHVADVERVLAYRMLRFARGDSTALPGFEPADYVAAYEADQLRWSGIVEEFAAVREATLALFRNLPPGAWMREGIADGSPYTVRGIAYTLVGHGIHHRKLIQESYLRD